MRLIDVFLILLAGWAEGAKILAFTPFPIPSHHRQLQPIFRELASRGHHLTVYTSNPVADPPPNYTQVVVSTELMSLKKLAGKNGKENPLTDNLDIMGSWNSIWIRDDGLSRAEKILQTPEVQKLIHSDEKFDALFTITCSLSEPYVALKHKFNTVASFEFIPVDSFHHGHFIYGSPIYPSFAADMFLPYTDRMSFWQRMHSALFSLVYLGVWNLYYMPKYQALMDKYIRYDGWQSRPSIGDMLSNVSFVFINHHEATHSPYPLSPHFKEIGGVHLEPVKPLPEELKKFMDDAEEGVIYFSLGSLVNSENTLGEHRKYFIEVFSQLKQRVVWKMEGEIANLSSNVMIGTWFPQQSLLAHKNMKLFINQGGALSVMEALHHGVPMVSIPIWSDQFKNTAHMHQQGYGIGLRGDNITTQTIMDTIQRVLNDKRYKEEAMRRKRMIRDSKETPLERVSYWVEYALRHRGAQHMRPASVYMSWYSLVMVDVYVVLLLVFIFLLGLLYTSVSFLLKTLPKLISISYVTVSRSDKKINCNRANAKRTKKYI